jgi:hypothetical protein
MPAQRLSTFLSSGTLGSLCDASERVRELQRVFFDSAPPSLAPAARVQALRAGTLYVSVDSAAVAAKLRQLAPRLLTAIHARVPEVNGIRIAVQVSAGAGVLRNNSKKRPLTIETVENFEKLAAAMADSELKTAVSKLIRRHRRRSTSQ